MRSRYVRNSVLAIYGMFLLIVMHSCANMGTPNGGPYDEDPPRFISSTPSPNQTNFSGKKIEILFDELIQVDKPSENVIITPPQKELPIIRTAGRKVVVELKDTLVEHTTYTIDFTNSIADNNEKNVLENFSFAFSTGDVIDSLEVSGILLNAENLEPMTGITIGLHSNLEDSAFVTLPFIRTSRTNDRGRFTIRNIAPGTYRIYALNDVNRDYMFDQPGEDIAFLDSLVVPYIEMASRQDTIWADSLTVDTIYTVGFNRYLPDDIQLRLFREEFERQYILRPERPVDRRFTLRFNAPLDTIPTPVPVNFYPVDSVWYFPQEIDGGRAVNYWIMDSTVWQQDTLMISVDYLKSDSLNILRPQTDTVRAAIRRLPAERKRKKNNDEPEPIDFLEMQLNASGTRDMFDTITVTFSEPVIHIDKELFFLNQKQDTLWVPVDFDFIPDSTNSLNFFIQRPWRYGEEYLLEVDSATLFSIYDKWNDTYSSQFKIRARDEYGHLYLNIQGVNEPAFVELLNSSDKPVRQATVKDGGVLFMNLKPDKYYARLIMDRNQNGKWDTGNYAEKRQPEEVFYSPKMYDVKQNWEVEETWDVKALPLPEQKPLEITKNKPKEDVKRDRDYRNEGKNVDNNIWVLCKRSIGLYLLVILICLPAVLTAQQIPVKSRINVGEQVEYDVYFKWGLLMPKAGQATISVSQGRYESRPGNNYKLLFRTTGMFERIFKMRDTLESNFTQDFQLIKNQKRALEGGRYMVDDLFFTHMSNQTKVRSHRYSLRETKIDTVMYAKGIVLDMLSATLYLRSLDWNKMSSGNEFPITVPIGRDMVNVRFRYNGQAIVERGENVKYKTRHFYIDIYDEAFTQSKEAAEIWIGDDENHIPVKIRAKLKIGAAEVYYKSSSNLRYPLNSRVEIK